MKKLSLLKTFMKNYVGKGFHLIIKENNDSFKVHTIEIMQKTDDSCPVTNMPIGDYFLHLVATNPAGKEASIVCDWSDDLLKSLLSSYKDIQDAHYSQVTMLRDPLSNDPNKWLLLWGNNNEGIVPIKDPVGYIC